MQKATHIELKFSVEEINVVLEALGQMPFVKVYALIESIQQQAARQLSSANGDAAALKPESQANPAIKP